MSRPLFRCRAARAGFTLIEALVAFAILAIGLGTLSTGIAAALRGDGEAAATEQTLRLAETLLAEAGLARPLSDARGETPEGLKWELSVTGGVAAAADPSAATSRPAPGKDGRPLPVWIEVVVFGPRGARTELGRIEFMAPLKTFP